MKAELRQDPELKIILNQFRFAVALSLAVITTGTVFYHIVEKLNWLDAVYFSTITLATVGYGDIVPHTDAGKIFTIFYVLVGISIIGALANLLVKQAVAIRAAKDRGATKTTKR